jgi:hypothetical protein
MRDLRAPATASPCQQRRGLPTADFDGYGVGASGAAIGFDPAVEPRLDGLVLHAVVCAGKRRPEAAGIERSWIIDTVDL